MTVLNSTEPKPVGKIVKLVEDAKNDQSLANIDVIKQALDDMSIEQLSEELPKQYVNRKLRYYIYNRLATLYLARIKYQIMDKSLPEQDMIAPEFNRRVKTSLLPKKMFKKHLNSTLLFTAAHILNDKDISENIKSLADILEAQREVIESWLRDPEVKDDFKLDILRENAKDLQSAHEFIARDIKEDELSKKWDYNTEKNYLQSRYLLMRKYLQSQDDRLHLLGKQHGLTHYIGNAITGRKRKQNKKIERLQKDFSLLQQVQNYYVTFKEFEENMNINADNILLDHSAKTVDDLPDKSYFSFYANNIRDNANYWALSAKGLTIKQRQKLLNNIFVAKNQVMQRIYKVVYNDQESQIYDAEDYMKLLQNSGQYQEDLDYIFDTVLDYYQYGYFDTMQEVLNYELNYEEELGKEGEERKSMVAALKADLEETKSLLIDILEAKEHYLLAKKKVLGKTSDITKTLKETTKQKIEFVNSNNVYLDSFENDTEEIIKNIHKNLDSIKGGVSTLKTMGKETIAQFMMNSLVDLSDERHNSEELINKTEDYNFDKHRQDMRLSFQRYADQAKELYQDMAILLQNIWDARKNNDDKANNCWYDLQLYDILKNMMQFADTNRKVCSTYSKMIDVEKQLNSLKSIGETVDEKKLANFIEDIDTMYNQSLKATVEDIQANKNIATNDENISEGVRHLINICVKAKDKITEWERDDAESNSLNAFLEQIQPVSQSTYSINQFSLPADHQPIAPCVASSSVKSPKITSNQPTYVQSARQGLKPTEVTHKHVNDATQLTKQLTQDNIQKLRAQNQKILENAKVLEEINFSAKVVGDVKMVRSQELDAGKSFVASFALNNNGENFAIQAQSIGGGEYRFYALLSAGLEGYDQDEGLHFAYCYRYPLACNQDGIYSLALDDNQSPQIVRNYALQKNSQKQKKVLVDDSQTSQYMQDLQEGLQKLDPNIDIVEQDKANRNSLQMPLTQLTIKQMGNNGIGMAYTNPSYVN